MSTTDPEPAAASGAPIPDKRAQLWFGLLFGGLFVLITGLVLAFELDPFAGPSPKLPTANGRISHRQVIGVYIALCGVSIAGVLGWGALRSRTGPVRRRVHNAAKILLTLAVLSAGFNYFYGRRGLSISHFAHRWDTYHYLLGPRYYAEIDYADLYACTAETLSTRAITDANAVRELRTYRMTKVGELRKEPRCTDNFTPERRARWEADLALFTDGDGLHTLRDAIEDRGYNGSPFHSAVSGFIADRIPLTVATHQMVPLLDVATLCAMLFVVATAFGWKVGLVFALFFFTSAADRWGIIGGSFFRYQWMVTLGLSLAALRRKKYTTAGFFMALSTLLNIFPVVFSVGLVVRALRSWRSQGRLPTRYRRFFGAAIITGVIGLGIGALPARGIDNYTSWKANMELHNVERFQGFGLGLKFPFTYQGGLDAKSDKLPESKRRAQFHRTRSVYYVLAGLLISLALGVASRTEDDVEAAGLVGFTLFFGVLGTVGYYFACAAVLVLTLHRRLRTPGGLILLALFFVTSLLGHLALYDSLYYRFMYNTVLSMGWTVWLTALLFWLAHQEGILARVTSLIAPPASAASPPTDPPELPPR